MEHGSCYDAPGTSPVKQVFTVRCAWTRRARRDTVSSRARDSGWKGGKEAQKSPAVLGLGADWSLKLRALQPAPASVLVPPDIDAQLATVLYLHRGLFSAAFFVERVREFTSGTEANSGRHCVWREPLFERWWRSPDVGTRVLHFLMGLAQRHTQHDGNRNQSMKIPLQSSSGS